MYETALGPINQEGVAETTPAAPPTQTHYKHPARVESADDSPSAGPMARLERIGAKAKSRQADDSQGRAKLVGAALDQPAPASPGSPAPAGAK